MLQFIFQCGAVIADVGKQQVRGLGYFRSNHPLKHSVMVAIDSVAYGHGGGVWADTPRVPSR